MSLSCGGGANQPRVQATGRPYLKVRGQRESFPGSQQSGPVQHRLDDDARLTVDGSARTAAATRSHVHQTRLCRLCKTMPHGQLCAELCGDASTTLRRSLPLPFCTPIVSRPRGCTRHIHDEHRHRPRGEPHLYRAHTALNTGGGMACGYVSGFVLRPPAKLPPHLPWLRIPARV
jgi:hypothetical protein